MNFKTFPALSTSRLRLRQLSPTDAADIAALRSDPSVNKYILRPATSSIDDAVAFITKINEGIKQGKNLYWAICIKNKPKLIGTICLWNFSDDMTVAELGYELDPLYQRMGIMNEAIKTVLNFSTTTLRLNKVEAFTHKDNEASTQLLLKNNFKLEPGRKDEDNPNNAIYSLVFRESYGYN